MKVKDIKTIEDAEHYCEGMINDFESGISNKKETMEAMLEYTIAIHDLFWYVAKKQVKRNINYFEVTTKRNKKHFIKK